jgi:hypothetical protein
VGHDLDDAVDLGFFGLFGRVLLWVLGLIHGVVGSWGMAIILLTVGVKLLFWPLTRASFVSSRKMAALSPKIEELRQLHKDDPQKAGAAQMELFAKEGVNPLSGCLPVLVQTPVWIALYSALLYSSELYHAEFFYLKDLASADPLRRPADDHRRAHDAPAAHDPDEPGHGPAPAAHHSAHAAHLRRHHVRLSFGPGAILVRQHRPVYPPDVAHQPLHPGRDARRRCQHQSHPLTPDLRGVAAL